MGTDIPLPQKAEVPAPPLDTSSQASVEEMETSLESNPINIYPPMAACSSHSDSPMVDLTELEADANLAANYMLSVKRSLDLQRQQAIWEFEVLLHQQEAKEATANKRAKIIHSRKDLDAKVGCTKAVMKAMYDYRWPSRKPERLDAANSKSWKLPIWRPLVKMLPQGPLSVQYSTGNM